MCANVAVCITSFVTGASNYFKWQEHRVQLLGLNTSLWVFVLVVSGTGPAWVTRLSVATRRWS